MDQSNIEMSEESERPKPGYIRSLLEQKCSRCRTGDMFLFKNPYRLGRFMKMHDHCPACGQPLEIEIGFYYGTGYVSYVMTVILSGISFLGWWAVVGLSLNDNRIFGWIAFNIVLLIFLQPFLMRLSRAIWLSFFVPFNPNWRTEKPELRERG
jgi:uncharacterized protein (DUF983 family)